MPNNSKKTEIQIEHVDILPLPIILGVTEDIDTQLSTESGLVRGLRFSGTKEEKDRLQQLEKVIEKGAVSSYAAGFALAAIRDERLYKHYGCKTFQEYCEKRFSVSRSYAYRLIAYNRVRELLGYSDSSKRLIPEGLVRPIANLPKAEIEGIWNRALEACETDVPDSESLKEAIQQYRQEAHGKKIAKCQEEANCFYSEVLKKKVDVSEIDNIVEYLISCAQEDIKSLQALYSEFSTHISFKAADKTKLLAVVKGWQKTLLDDFSSTVNS